jgi:hypothetical protein
MSQLKLIAAVASFSLLMVGTASADPWGRYHRGYYRHYGPPVVAYPPVIVAGPPVVVAPPVYAYPAPIYAAPPAPIYAPPVYGGVVVGPRGRVRMGYATPGFGVYLGR